MTARLVIATIIGLTLGVVMHTTGTGCAEKFCDPAVVEVQP